MLASSNTGDGGDRDEVANYRSCPVGDANSALARECRASLELLTILTPVLDPTVFTNWPGDEFAWSSSTIPAIPGSFWLGGITGASAASAPTSMNRVQCVR